MVEAAGTYSYHRTVNMATTHGFGNMADKFILVEI
jgi:hypothetical protein